MYVLLSFIFGSMIESSLSFEVSLLTPKNSIIQYPIKRSSSSFNDPALFSRHFLISELKDEKDLLSGFISWLYFLKYYKTTDLYFFTPGFVL